MPRPQRGEAVSSGASIGGYEARGRLDLLDSLRKLSKLALPFSRARAQPRDRNSESANIRSHVNKSAAFRKESKNSMLRFWLVPLH
jgi:hypothetical protein